MIHSLEARFLLQEVQEVLPEMVTSINKEVDEHLSVKYANIVAIAVEAIKELDLEISENKKMMAVMQGNEKKVLELEGRIAALEEASKRDFELELQVKENKKLLLAAPGVPRELVAMAQGPWEEIINSTYGSREKKQQRITLARAR